MGFIVRNSTDYSSWSMRYFLGTFHVPHDGKPPGEPGPVKMMRKPAPSHGEYCSEIKLERREIVRFVD